MRNDSSLLPSLRRLTVLGMTATAVLFLSAQKLHAQCYAGNDTDLSGCSQQSFSLSSTGASQASANTVTLSQQSGQGAPQADHATDASADNSIAGEQSYTEPGLSSLSGSTGQHVQQPLPPEPPSEFQRFVAATTGQRLPIYGARLFTTHPVSFGPIDHAPAPRNMVIGVGDELRIRIWGQVNFSANLRVSREGEIYLPKAGAVHVAGLEFSSLAGHLRQALDRVYRNFELSVDLGEIHSIQVYVTGEARQPGEYTVSALSTLVDAIFQSGGPSRNGSLRHVLLKREGRVITDFDFYALLVKGDKTGDVQLQPGDVLFIPAVGPQVALLGSVRQKAIYELRGEETMAELLAAAGGRSTLASGERISVERTDGHAQRRAFELSPDASGLATVMADGDIVRINPIVPNYRETVTLRGSVANPGRFRWYAGMRLSNLIPDRDSLVARDYWWNRTQLGLPAPEFMPLPDASAAQIQAGGSSSSSMKRSSSALSGLRSQQSFSVDDSSLVRQGELNNHPLETTKTLGNTVVDTPIGRATALMRPVAETDWNYAVIERLDPSTMTTSLIPFDLGKLVLEHDAAQDLELEPGDTVTIFSQDDIPQPQDKQIKYVSLKGEFVHAGVYSVRPGETLRSLIVRAGGLTDKAYLYGSEFTRKSTQKIEEERLKEYADRLEHQLARSSIAMASTASSGAQQQQGIAASFDHELVGRLRQLKPSGRIVLQLNPRSTNVNQLPEMPLENGDQLLVPPTPSTIQVVGAVFNQNAFIYHNGASVGEYLHYAGGPNRDADRKQSFVLRADGSVTSYSAGQSIFSSGFKNVRLYPGDTIVVPEKNIGPGALRGILSWTQLFSQLALGGAAIGVIM